MEYEFTLPHNKTMDKTAPVHQASHWRIAVRSRCPHTLASRLPASDLTHPLPPDARPSRYVCATWRNMQMPDCRLRVAAHTNAATPQLTRSRPTLVPLGVCHLVQHADARLPLALWHRVRLDRPLLCSADSMCSFICLPR